ncbi:hypothetical protein L596_023686 [Steinernema carpocapsae]|nr:hypothetical protein L596_023686 [Steinernema carpocapsae]
MALQANQEPKLDFESLSRSAIVESMRSGSTGTPPAPIPGAIAVAASPAAALFGEDDWSWHRNPAAAIRSGGTNKQTPVWKYFVYNKAENLSRCIIGDCTYMLKGPHTSTLACHLKKHPVEYAEFQKLKVEYTRERAGGFANSSSPQSNASAGSNSSGCGGSGGAKPKPPSSNNLLELSALFGNQPTTPTSNGNGTPRAAEPKTPTTIAQDVNSKQSNISNLLNMLNARALASSQPQNSTPTTPVLQQIANPVNFLNLMKQLPQGVPGLAFGNMPQTSMANLVQVQRASANPAPTPAVEPPPKKWPRQERKQRDLEAKLALMMATAQVSPQLVNNPFFRDFIETAQPKFAVPTEPTFLEEIINGQHQRSLSSIKFQLLNAPKVAVLIDVLKVGGPSGTNGMDDQSTSDGCDLDDASVSASGSAPRLCIFGAFYSSTTLKVEVVLLGIRALTRESRSPAMAIKNCVESLLEEYQLSQDKISRIVLNGLAEIGLEDEVLFANQLDPVNHKLAEVLSSVYEEDQIIQSLSKHFYAMILSFLTRPDASTALNKMAGRTVEFPVADSFFVLAEAVLEVREAFLGACLQQPLDNPMEMLSEGEWAILGDATRMLRMFHNHMAVVQDGSFATIDRVIPALKQIQNTLDKEFVSLGDLTRRIKEDVVSRFHYILDPESDAFDASFILATALNPQLANQLDENQLSFAQKTLERMLTEKLRIAEEALSRGTSSNAMNAFMAVMERKASNASTLLTQASSSSTTSSSTCSPPLPSNDGSGNGTLTLYPDLILSATKIKQDSQSRNPLAETLVQSYFDELANKPSSTCLNPIEALTVQFSAHHLPPLQFWQFQLVKNTPLADMALELLCTPSCSVSLERLFGEGENPTSFDLIQVLKALEDPDRFERNSMLRFNRSHIPRSF